MSKITVDEDLCIGCGICSSICPEVFEIKDDGKSHILAESCDSCDISEAETSCPEQAIIIK